MNNWFNNSNNTGNKLRLSPGITDPKTLGQIKNPLDFGTNPQQGDLFNFNDPNPFKPESGRFTETQNQDGSITRTPIRRQASNDFLNINDIYFQPEGTGTVLSNPIDTFDVTNSIMDNAFTDVGVGTVLDGGGGALAADVMRETGPTLADETASNIDAVTEGLTGTGAGELPDGWEDSVNEQIEDVQMDAAGIGDATPLNTGNITHAPTADPNAALNPVVEQGVTGQGFLSKLQDAFKTTAKIPVVGKTFKLPSTILNLLEAGGKILGLGQGEGGAFFDGRPVDWQTTADGTTKAFVPGTDHAVLGSTGEHITLDPSVNESIMAHTIPEVNTGVIADLTQEAVANGAANLGGAGSTAAWLGSLPETEQSRMRQYLTNTAIQLSIQVGKEIPNFNDPNWVENFWDEHGGQRLGKYGFGHEELYDAEDANIDKIFGAMEGNFDYGDAMRRGNKLVDNSGYADALNRIKDYYWKDGQFETDINTNRDALNASYGRDIEALKQRYGIEQENVAAIRAKANARRAQYEGEVAQANATRNARDAESSILRNSLADVYGRNAWQTAGRYGSHEGGGTPLDAALLGQQGRFATDAAKLAAQAAIKEQERLQEIGPQALAELEALGYESDAAKANQDAQEYIMDQIAKERAIIATDETARNLITSGLESRVDMPAEHASKLIKHDAQRYQPLQELVNQWRGLLDPNSSGYNMQTPGYERYQPKVQEPELSFGQQFMKHAPLAIGGLDVLNQTGILDGIGNFFSGDGGTNAASDDWNNYDYSAEDYLNLSPAEQDAVDAYWEDR